MGEVRDEQIFEELIDSIEAARLLGVPRSWVYSAADDDKIPSFKIGKYRRFRLSELRAWLEQQRNGQSLKSGGER